MIIKKKRIVLEEQLFGPASTLARRIIYPCSRHRCHIPCPCCLRQTHTCNDRDNQVCSCSGCMALFQDHQLVHMANYNDCKYCENMLEIFPCFNYNLVPGGLKETKEEDSQYICTEMPKTIDSQRTLDPPKKKP